MAQGQAVRATAPQPRGTGADKYNWHTLDTGWGTSGYRVYIKKGKRYIQNYWTSTDGLGNWTANITTSKWTKSGWKKVSAKTKAVTAAQVKKTYPGTFTGEDQLREVLTRGAQITDSDHASGFPKRWAVMAIACSWTNGSSSRRPAVVTSLS